MARKGVLISHSDVNLAVWGLYADDYFEAVGLARPEVAPFSVDLARTEQAPDFLRAVVRDDGREVPLCDDRQFCFCLRLPTRSNKWRMGRSKSTPSDALRTTA